MNDSENDISEARMLPDMFTVFIQAYYNNEGIRK